MVGFGAAGEINIEIAIEIEIEVGIDIGSLQACVVAGYPGSIASLRQQSGRAGRRATDYSQLYPFLGSLGSSRRHRGRIEAA